MESLDNFINHAVGSWGYYAVFAMLAVEGFGLFFVPGETTLIAASFAAGATHKLSIIFVVLADANHMRRRRFAPVNAAASLVWVCACAYALGHTSKTVLEAISIAIFVIFCALFTAGWIYFHRYEEEFESWADAALPGPLHAARPKDLRPQS